jgi:GTP-binding protein
MIVKQSEFVISNTDIKKCPSPTIPEYAFIGRSNVGKSSLINSITKRKSLAKISGKPGKTQLINHFIINESWYLVDLPGYGYASVSKKATTRICEVYKNLPTRKKKFNVSFCFNRQ